MNLLIALSAFFVCVIACFKLHDIETEYWFLAAMLFAVQFFLLLSSVFCFFYIVCFFV
jgi:hypothetical protein